MKPINILNIVTTSLPVKFTDAKYKKTKNNIIVKKLYIINRNLILNKQHLERPDWQHVNIVVLHIFWEQKSLKKITLFLFFRN